MLRVGIDAESLQQETTYRLPHPTREYKPLNRVFTCERRKNRDRKFRDNGGFMMKASSFKYVLVGIAILMGTNAFAANNGSLNLISPVTVAGTRLAAGNYNVQWEGSGPGVQLSVRKGQKIVASTPAELIPVDHPFDNNEAVIGVEDDGKRKLIEIHFSGKKFALEIEPQSAGTRAGRNDTDSW
jgi:hypothetical protein